MFIAEPLVLFWLALLRWRGARTGGRLSLRGCGSGTLEMACKALCEDDVATRSLLAFG